MQQKEARVAEINGKQMKKFNHQDQEQFKLTECLVSMLYLSYQVYGANRVWEVALLKVNFLHFR